MPGDDHGLDRGSRESISRIESGQRKTSPDMLRKLAQALDGKAVMGFDFGTVDEPRPELVTLS